MAADGLADDLFGISGWDGHQCRRRGCPPLFGFGGRFAASDSEQPEVQTIEFPNEIMRLSLAGNRIDELRRLARQLENDLLALGIVQVDLRGLPDEVIEIRLDQNRLSALGLTPSDIGRQISAQNLDVSAGDLDGAGSSRLFARAFAAGERGGAAFHFVVGSGGQYGAARRYRRDCADDGG